MSSYTGYKIIIAENPRCQLGYELVINPSNNSHACVTPDTAQKLIERGWAAVDFRRTQAVEPFDNWLVIDVHYTNGTYAGLGINYTITANNQLLDVKFNNIAKELKLSLDSPNNGTLKVTIPRQLLDAKIHNQDDQFIVLANGQEIPYKEIHKTITDRTLSIPFQQGTNTIEIIVTTLI